MTRNLLILGAGPYGTVVKEIAAQMDCFEKISFLDDSFGLGEGEGSYHEVSIGRLDDYDKFFEQYSFAIAALEDQELRKKLSDRLRESLYQIPILVSPEAYVSKSAQLRYGVIIEPKAVVMSNTCIGVGTLISAGAVVKQNSFVGEYCNIASNAVIANGAFLPSNAKVEEGVIAGRSDPFSHLKK